MSGDGSQVAKSSKEKAAAHDWSIPLFFKETPFFMIYKKCSKQAFYY